MKQAVELSKAEVLHLIASSGLVSGIFVASVAPRTLAAAAEEMPELLTVVGEMHPNDVMAMQTKLERMLENYGMIPPGR